MAGLDGGGEGGVAVRRAGHRRIDRALFLKRDPGLGLGQFARLRAVGGDDKILLAEVQRSGNMVDDRLRLQPRIGRGGGEGGNAE